MVILYLETRNGWALGEPSIDQILSHHATIEEAIEAGLDFASSWYGCKLHDRPIESHRIAWLGDQFLKVSSCARMQGIIILALQEGFLTHDEA